MDSQQRLLRRRWLFDNAELLYAEARYHAEHREDESLPGYDLWNLDSDEGMVDHVATQC